MTAVAQVGTAWRVLSFVWTHPANRRRRMRGVARAVRFQVRGRLGRPTMTAVGSRGRMRVWRHDTAAARSLYANPPDWNEMRAWRRILRPGDLFVDVGSNVGGYALWAADAGADVIAVEPSPAAATRLRANVALNDFPIAVRECALGATPGLAWLTGDRGATNHLLPGPAPAAQQVALDTLDNLLGDRYAAGVKIDVEGAERLVLEGARRALAEARIGVLQIEWNAMSQRLLGETRAPVAALLASHGYTVVLPGSDGGLRRAAVPAVSPADAFAVGPAVALPG
jgi:FkbM family methyltransferase